MVVVTVGPQGHIHLPGRNAQTAQHRHAESGFLPAPSVSGTIHAQGTGSPAVRGPVCSLGGKPVIHCKQGLMHIHPRNLLSQFPVEKRAVIRQIFIIHPMMQHIAREGLLRHLPRKRPLLPQKNPVPGIGLEQLRRIIQGIA